MVALVTKAQLQEHLETDLVDDALDRLIADADREIVRAYGPHAADGDVTLELRGDVPRLWFDRPFASITSVTEYDASETALVLVASDCRLWHDGFMLERLTTGTNGRSSFNRRVAVVGAPVDDDDIRTRVTLDLCRLAAEYSPQRSRRQGDFASTSVDYEDERKAILRRCRSTVGAL